MGKMYVLTREDSNNNKRHRVRLLSFTLSAFRVSTSVEIVSALCGNALWIFHLHWWSE